MSCLHFILPPNWLHHDIMIYTKHIALGRHRYTKPDTHLVSVHLGIDMIHCTSRRGHSSIPFQGNVVNIIRFRLRLNYTFFTFFPMHYHTSEKNKHTFPHHPSPSLSRALLLTQFLTSSVRRGEKGKWNGTCPFPLAQTPLTHRSQ